LQNAEASIYASSADTGHDLVGEEPRSELPAVRNFKLDDVFTDVFGKNGRSVLDKPLKSSNFRYCSAN
jgi:hypothetical protein